MECAKWREALSARVDDELADVESQALDAHLRACADCAEHAERLAALTRATRLQAAGRVPDLTPQILARLHGEPSPAQRQAGLRAGLGGLAAVLIALALPDLLGGGQAHAVREVASWHVALAVGFVAAAWRPVWALGLVPVLTAATIGMALTAGLDVAGGHTSLLGEVPHAVKIVGLGVLWELSRRVGPPAYRRGVA